VAGSDAAAEAGFRLLIVVFGLFLLVISLFVWPIVLAIQSARQTSRREAMARNATELGLRMQEQQSKSIVGGFKHLDQLSNPMGAFDKYALNIIQGDYLGNNVTLFDYHYALSDGVWWWAPSWTTHHYSSFVVLHMESNFPELIIQKEGFRMFEKIAEAFGGGDIDFESKEFSDRFKVRSKNRKFAYDFCNAKMIDYLLDQPIVAMEVEKDTLAIGLGSQGNDRLIVPHLRHLTNIRTLIPRYLFDRKTHQAREGTEQVDPTDLESTDNKQRRRPARRVSIYEPATDGELSDGE
jgi:hypothetical protein